MYSIHLFVIFIIIFFQARDAINRGDVAMASTYSQMARKYAYTAIGLGIVLYIIGVVLRVVVYSAYISTNNTYN